MTKIKQAFYAALDARCDYFIGEIEKAKRRHGPTSKLQALLQKARHGMMVLEVANSRQPSRVLNNGKA